MAPAGQLSNPNPNPNPNPNQHKPWLLEVNSGPDLSLFGARRRPLGLSMLRELLQVLEAEAIFGSTLGSTPPPQPEEGGAEGGAEGMRPLPSSGALVGGFECVFVRRCAEPAGELARFKRLMSLAGRFAHSLHQTSGAPVRGVQGLVRQGQARTEARAAATAEQQAGTGGRSAVVDGMHGGET